MLGSWYENYRQQFAQLQRLPEVFSSDLPPTKNVEEVRKVVQHPESLFEASLHKKPKINVMRI